MRPLDRIPRAAAPAWRVAALSALAVLPAFADAVTLSPVRVDVTPAHPVATLTVSNPGSTPVRFQAQVLAWGQREGVDQREASSDLIVAPGIADIPAGGRQIFRIAARTPASGAERAYRLVLEDIGEAAPADGASAIRLRINHDLPVFVTPDGLAPAKLVLAPCAQPAPTCVRVRNDGATHGVVRSLHFTGVAWQKDQAVNARILAGAWREWRVDAPANVQVTGVRATLGSGEQTLALSRR
jgi:fimbrial chaperone protein